MRYVSLAILFVNTQLKSTAKVQLLFELTKHKLTI